MTADQPPVQAAPKKLVVKEKRKLERRVRKWSAQRVPLPGHSAVVVTQWRLAAAALPAVPVLAPPPPQHAPVLRWASEAEYATLPVQARWSAALSARLVELCAHYALRWPVVHDRWLSTDEGAQPPHSAHEDAPPFTLEELKERYYTLQRALASACGDSADTAPPPYARLQEERRKRQLALLSGVDASTHAAAVERHIALRRAQLKHRRDAVKVCKVATLLVTTTSDQTHGLGGKARGARGGRDSAGRLRQPPKTILDEKSGVQAQKHAAAVSAALSELGVRKPSAAQNTFKVAEKYNVLRDALAVLCELQRLQAEAAYDVAVLKAHKTALRSALKGAGDAVPSAEAEGAPQQQAQQQQRAQDDAMLLEEEQEEEEGDALLLDEDEDEDEGEEGDDEDEDAAEGDDELDDDGDDGDDD